MSVFNCTVKFKVVEGNSFATTYNKLQTQGFVDSNLTLKVPVPVWERGKDELNLEASTILKKDVSLFTEKRLLSGTKLIPNMEVFAQVDSINRDVRDNRRKIFTNTGHSPFEKEEQYGPSDVNSMYAQLGLRDGEFITNERKEEATAIISEINRLNPEKVLSLREVASGKFLVSTIYKENYLHRANDNAPLEDTSEIFEETDSNTNFNVPCFK